MATTPLYPTVQNLTNNCYTMHRLMRHYNTWLGDTHLLTSAYRNKVALISSRTNDDFPAMIATLETLRDQFADSEITETFTPPPIIEAVELNTTFWHAQMGNDLMHGLLSMRAVSNNIAAILEATNGKLNAEHSAELRGCISAIKTLHSELMQKIHE